MRKQRPIWFCVVGLCFLAPASCFVMLWMKQSGADNGQLSYSDDQYRRRETMASLGVPDDAEERQGRQEERQGRQTEYVMMVPFGPPDDAEEHDRRQRESDGTLLSHSLHSNTYDSVLAAATFLRNVDAIQFERVPVNHTEWRELRSRCLIWLESQSGQQLEELDQRYRDYAELRPFQWPGATSEWRPEPGDKR